MNLKSTVIWWTTDEGSAKAYLTDVLAGFVYIAAATGVLLLTPDFEFGRILVAVPLLVFLPGYAVLATLFPGNDVGYADRLLPGATGPEDGHGIELGERFALSVVLSAVLTPTLGLALAVSGHGVSVVPMASLLVVVSVAGMTIGAFRRSRLPHDRRFSLPLGRWSHRLRTAVAGTSSPLGITANVVLALSIVFAVGVLGYGLLGASPGSGPFDTGVSETDTSLMLLTESENGSLVDDGYPTNVTAGEPTELTAAVVNDEGEQVEYTVVVQLQRIDLSTSPPELRDYQNVTRLQQTVAANETWHADHTVSPELTGTNLRLTYLLYKGDPPAEPPTESPYRHAYVWMNVTSGE